MAGEVPEGRSTGTSVGVIELSRLLKDSIPPRYLPAIGVACVPILLKRNEYC